MINSFVLRKFQRHVAGMTILAILTSFVSFAGVAQANHDFPDVADDHFAHDFISELVDQGVISGYLDGTFGPENTMTRAELAKVAVLAFLGEDQVDTSYDAGFVDVEDSAWYSDYVNTAAKFGIVGGYTDEDGNATGYYGPFDNVNRAAAAKILVGAAGLVTDTTGGPHFPDVDEGTWYYDYVETAYNNSVVDGYENGMFGPADAVLRGQAAKMTVNAQNPVPRPPEPTEPPVVGGDGTMTVELISMSGGTVPKSATAVPVLGLEVTANGDDMTLETLVIDRQGVGSTNDFSNLYFYHGAERIGSGHSISSDTNQATFASLGVDVMDGDTETIWIKADFSSTATASNENYFTVMSEDEVEVTGGVADGDFPLSGPLFTIGGATAGTITIEKNSTVSNPTIGQTEAEIADFKLIATNEDMSIEQIALTFKGTIAPEGGTNFQLWQNGEVLATTDDVDSNELFTFMLDTPFVIEKGDTRIFTVTAEITSSADASDTIQVYLDEKTDLVAIGDVYGYGAAVTDTLYDNSAADGTDANHSTVQGGKLTIAFNGPAAFNFASNTRDLSFLDLTFTAGRDLEVRQLAFTVAATGSGLIDADGGTANYTDIKLIDSDSGATLMGPKELSTSGSDSSQTLTYTDTWNMDEGETVNASLVLDVANETTLDDTPSVVTVTMSAISTTEGVKDIGTGEFLTDIVPSTSIAGYGHTAQDASLSVALASSPVSDTVVKGAQKVTLVGFNFTAGDASDVEMIKFLPTVAFSLEDTGAAGTWSVSGSTGSTTYAKELVTTLYLYDEEGNQIGDAEAVPNGGKPTFDGFSFVIPAGETKTVYVKGDIATTAPAEGTADLVGIDIEATGDVTAYDADSNTVTLGSVDTNGSTDANATTVAFTINSAGSIVVSDPASQENDRLTVTDGSTEVLIGRVKVKATNEDFNVDKISLFATNSGSEDSFKSLKIKFPTDLGSPTTLNGSSSQVFSGTAVTFSNLDFPVPSENDNVVFEIYGVANTHADDSGASDSGDNLQVTLYPYGTSFEATGIGSGTTKTGADSGVIPSTGVSTNKPYVFKSIPTVAVPTTAKSIVYGAQSEVLRFTVNANANGDLALLGLRMDVSSSGILTGSTGLGGSNSGITRGDGTVGRWEMFEVVTGSIDYGTQVGSGEYIYNGHFNSNFSDEVYMDVYDNTDNWGNGSGAFEKVSAGGTRTYVVTTTVSDDGTDNTNSISVRIGNDSTASHNQTSFAVVGEIQSGTLASAGFIWADRPNASGFGTGSVTVNAWHNGYKVSGLPTSYETST